ncbi:MAG: rod-binding protein [Alphaproteobacteria bacterium]|nr:rod-binding protein [Alphaproteobacteria bacterium]
MTANLLTADFISSAAPQKTAPKINKGMDIEKTRAAVEDFEAFFISQTFQQMYDTVPVNETFGGGNAEKIFRSMMIDEYGKMTAKAGGIGLTDQIMAQLLQQQEADTTAAVPAE